MVFLVTSQAEAFSVSDETPHLSLVTPAGGYPEWVAKGSANSLPSRLQTVFSAFYGYMDQGDL